MRGKVPFLEAELQRLATSTRGNIDPRKAAGKKGRDDQGRNASVAARTKNSVLDPKQQIMLTATPKNYAPTFEKEDQEFFSWSAGRV